MSTFNSKSKLKIDAKEYVPQPPKKDEPKGIAVFKSARYKGNDEDFDDIKRLFLSLRWDPQVKFVYVTNGWHEGFENGGWVTYCGYSVNEDSEFLKQHYYQ